MELKTHLAVPPIATCPHLLASRNKTVRFAGAASSKRRIEKRIVDSLETLLRSPNRLAKCCKKVDPKATRHCREEECERKNVRGEWAGKISLQLFAVPKAWHEKLPFLGTVCRIHIAHSIHVRSG